MPYSIRISKTMVDNFYKSWKKTYTGARLGQAFHQHFDLQKVTSKDKHLLDKLYQSDGDDAKGIIDSITDHMH